MLFWSTDGVINMYSTLNPWIALERSRDVL